jgi:hypothetical protein
MSLKDYELILDNIFKIPRNYQIPNQMQKNTESIINKLYINILNSKERVGNNPICSQGLGPLKNASNYKSIPQQIRDDIDLEDYANNYHKIELKSGRTVDLYMIFETDNKDDGFNAELYEKIMIWLSYLDLIARNDCSKNLTIYLILSSNKKVLPRNRQDEIDRQNANSAFTFSCKKNNEIFIYRAEEVFKVFLHESFHSFGLDFSSMDCDNANRIITNNFEGLDKQCDYRIYESYCEIWAQVINILVIVTRTKRNNHMNKINEYLFYERLWSIFQCAKVLHHYEVSYDDLLNKRNKYTETKTQVFSYYILKAIGMANINEFVNWSNKENSNIMIFTKNQENIKSYCNLLCNLSYCPEFMEDLNIVEKWFLNGKVTKKDVLALQSMRMSISE